MGQVASDGEFMYVVSRRPISAKAGNRKDRYRRRHRMKRSDMSERPCTCPISTSTAVPQISFRVYFATLSETDHLEVVLTGNEVCELLRFAQVLRQSISELQCVTR